ncbi:hypothetical protein B566_EDAN004662 [Ephemera danica]|nr:hypothetical protein B566_EDAN004662 [Ephemera danica]
MGKGNTSNVNNDVGADHTSPPEVIHQPKQDPMDSEFSIEWITEICLRCHHRKVAIINLPCKHVVCCESCAHLEIICSWCGVHTKADFPLN